MQPRLDRAPAKRDDDTDGKGAKASDDDDDKSDEDEPKTKKAKKARAEDDDDGKADDDEDDKQEMTGRSSAANARRRERARCAAIFTDPAAANNIPLAASLAFETTMTRSEAIAVLKGQEGRSSTAARSHREGRNADLGAGYDATTISPAAKANAVWDKAWSAIGVKKPAR